MNNDITFGMDGFSLDGTTWYNPKTGDSFKIRNNFFEDNNMIIQTMDGRRIDMNQMNNYVQWSGKDLPPKTPMVQSNPIDEIPPEVRSIMDTNEDSSIDSMSPNGINDMDPEDYAMINGGAPQTTLTTPIIKKTTSNYDIIDRALSKHSLPGVTLTLNWNDNFPDKAINMLIEMMDITPEEISDYYYNKLTSDMSTVIQDIKKQIADSISY